MQSTSSVAENTAFLPYLFHTGGQYEVGDTLEFTLEQSKYRFIVGGFFENMLASSMNGGLVTVVVTDEKFVEMRQSLSLDSLSVSAKLKDGVDDKKFTTKFINEVTGKRYIAYNTIWYTASKDARTVISGIIGAIIAIIAFLIVLIALIVIAFNINNKIEEDMRSLGVLKGLGYKSKQLVFSVVFQFFLIALISAMLGVALSYAVIPVIADMMIMQTGILWNYTFSTLAALISVFICCGVAGVVSLLSAKKIKKITPMTALRDGIETHSFKKNVLPVEKSKVGINTTLGLKALFRNTKQNAVITVILSLVTAIAIFAGVLFQNVAVDADNFIKIVTGESAHIVLSVSLDDRKDAETVMKSNSEIEKAYAYNRNNVFYSDTAIPCVSTDNFDDFSNKILCYEGRLPKHDNEVAVGGAFAKAQNIKIGDTAKFKLNKTEAEYVVTGFTQSTNYMGQDCMMTTAGFEKIGDFTSSTFFINVTEGADPAKVITALEEDLGGKIVSIMNIKEVEKGGAAVYVTIMTIVSLAAILVLLTVILLVLYLMVKTFILKKRKELGILKALGFSTNQLVYQTLMSFLPIVILGTILGCVLGFFATNPLFTLFLSGLGILKCMFDISAFVLLTVGLCVILFSAVITLLVSRRIKKISAYKMLVQD